MTMYRRFSSLLLSVILAAGFILTVTTRPAHAYIEIGSAGLLIQMLVASGFAALMAMKLYWRQLTGRVSRFLSRIKSPREIIK